MTSIKPWAELLEAHDGLYAGDGMQSVRGTISYDNPLPPTSSSPGASISVKAGTSVYWNGRHERELDHVNEVRWIERMAPGFLRHMPMTISFDGGFVGEAWIEMEAEGVKAILNNEDDEQRMSSLTATFARDDGEWTMKVEFSAVWTDSECDILLLDALAAAKVIRDHGWMIGDVLPEGWATNDQGEIVILLPAECFAELRLADA